MPGQKILTIIQLFVIIFLISFTIMVRKQVFYSINNLGYTKDNILEIELTPQLKKNVLQNELSKIPGFQSASFTNFGAGKDFPLWGSWMNNNGEEVKVSFYVLSCDPEFFEIMDIKCKKGRLFKKEMDNRDAFIVNETFVKHYGLEKLQETSIQARLRGNGGPNPIIGVVEDFNYYSVHRPISPLAIHCSGHDSRCLVKFSTSNFEELKSSYDKVNTICKKLSPAYPVTVDFLDKKITYMYRSEQRFQKLFTFFSISSIIIACMGIFSLLLYVIEMKIKEIGIRKINGAKIHEILTMLNTDFVKWVTIAFVIACPIGWYAMKRWLENFAYKTEISWWIFALSGAIAMVIALVTVSFQSYRAASKNPVESLRYE